jgi:hypothetical protein
LRQVSIADCSFLQYHKAFYLGGENINAAPVTFEWVLGEPQTARFVDDCYLTQTIGKGQIAWIQEPFFLHPENYLTVMGKQFDYVLTHDDTFVQNNRNWLWTPAGGSWVAFKDWGIKPKTKDVSIILSNKRSMRGHQLRHEVVEHCGDHLDVMGLDHPVTKVQGLADYRYSVIIENQKSRYWFTEKLIDAFALGTIPVYWGCPNIGKFFDERGIIEVDSLADIESVLESIDKRQYNAMLKYARDNLEIAREYAICEDWIFEHYPFLFEAA